MKQLVGLVVVVGCLAIGVIEVDAESATNVTAGGSHTCALTPRGDLVCWGDWPIRCWVGSRRTRRLFCPAASRSTAHKAIGGAAIASRSEIAGGTGRVPGTN